MNGMCFGKWYYTFLVIFSISLILLFVSWISPVIRVSSLGDQTSNKRQRETVYHEDEFIQYSNREELQKLGAKVQRRLQYIQNPKSCKTTRMLQCKIHRGCGMGCEINTISTCMMLAYALNRTMVTTPKLTAMVLQPFSSTCRDIKGSSVTRFGNDHAQHQVVQLQVNTNTYTPNFYPPAVPSDVYDGIYRYHDNPFLWWTGQVSAFVFKLSKTTYEDLLLDDYKEVFERPIVGIHVRRTDKLEQEARSHALDEYMKHVEAWFKHSSNSSEPRVFLATDDPSVIHEMKKRQKETVYHEDEFIQYSNREELQKLGAKVQRRLQYIQNPKICTTRRKLHCKIHSGCGMGCEINTLSTCMMLAYALNRTMVTSPKLTAMVLQPFSSTCRYIKGSNVTKFGKDHEQHQVVQLQVNTNSYKPNFYPPAVPSDLYDAILRYHDNPFLWWTGQISAFVLQISKTAYKNVLLDDYEEVFEKPIVGVHVRRTDKLIHEARFYPLDEYMKHVEAWFKHSSNSEPRVYLATDEPNVINEMKKRFTQFQVIYNANFTSAAKNKHRRRTAFGQLGIIHDMYMLSKCDYLVCTFSSNVCRLAFQLMNADRGNVTDRIVSLDRPWYLWDERQAVKGKRPVVKVEMPKYLDVD